MKNPGFGLYIHWPFCQSKCPYCDFNSHVSASINQSQWRQAYLSEIERLGEETDDRVLDTIYFGGGTPSLMQPDLVHAILDKVRSTWRQSNDVEITLEANPSSVDIARFRGYRDAGINRVSIGVQALDAEDLLKLGRLHSVAEAYRAIEVGNSLFERVNFDLIYARQNQTIAAWRDELTSALSLATSHLSLYQLTVEDGTVFQQRAARGQLSGLPNDDVAADMFDLTQDLCNAAGIPAYEVSNHARPGQESRHNQIYWDGGDYVGVGPGAHGRMTQSGRKIATEGIRLPNAWLDAVDKIGNGEIPRVTMSTEEAGAEYVMMGLRVRQGMSLTRYAMLTGHSLDISRVASLCDLGLLQINGDQLSAMGQGILVLNAIIRDLLT